MKMLLFLTFFLFLNLAIYGQAKVVHVFVALCDNENQGIVPVPKQLGNGNDPANNLYWGALYGLKTHFKKSKNWQLIKAEKNYCPNILERVIFKHKNQDFYLIADAYKGTKIKQATIDFLNAAGGKELKTNLAVYIGHNGLMDFTIQEKEIFQDTKDKKHPPAIILCCKSSQYFTPWLEKLKSEKLLLTTNFMAPEAYTLEAALEAYIKDENKKEIKEQAAQAYHKYQKCGINAARKLFK